MTNALSTFVKCCLCQILVLLCTCFAMSTKDGGQLQTTYTSALYSEELHSSFMFCPQANEGGGGGLGGWKLEVR